MIVPILSLIVIFVIIFGMYRLYKDDKIIKVHFYKEPKFDKEKTKKEIYKYLKESYKK